MAPKCTTMLWLIIFILWSLLTARILHNTTHPAIKLLFYLLALLGVLHLVIQTIDMIEYMMAVLSG
jgi:hypothetical protein